MHVVPLAKHVVPLAKHVVPLVIDVVPLAIDVVPLVKHQKPQRLIRLIVLPCVLKAPINE